MEPPLPCEALAQSQMVFYGEVLQVTERPQIVGANIAVLSVRFNVLRAFKGVKEGELLETVYYGPDAVRFEAKRRYLVYALRKPGAFLSVGCTRTVWLAANSEAVQLAEVNELGKCSGSTP
jgi:hypothetical protein